MKAETIKEINEKSPMGRCRGDWWHDELTEIQAHLMDALESVRSASNVGYYSEGSFVTEVTGDLASIEDIICVKLGEVVLKKWKIEKARSVSA